MKAEYLMQLTTYEEGMDVDDYYYSEKLDGLRLFWDGGVSRGHKKSSIPWADCWKDKKDYECTGLWSRLGNVVHAPDAWLDGLPVGVLLDGEGYNGVRERQALLSCLASETPDTRLWADVSLFAFDTVPWRAFCATRSVVYKDYCFHIVESKCTPWFKDCFDMPAHTPLRDRLHVLKASLGGNVMEVVQHRGGDYKGFYDSVISKGGEGVVFRHPASNWIGARPKNCIKMKGRKDSEAVVVGWLAGRDRLLGRVGALVVREGDIEFCLSGFTDQERESLDPEWCSLHPGEACPESAGAVMFPLGTVVTYTYWGRTNRGAPCEAAYLRERRD